MFFKTHKCGWLCKKLGLKDIGEYKEPTLRCYIPGWVWQCSIWLSGSNFEACIASGSTNILAGLHGKEATRIIFFCGAYFQSVFHSIQSFLVSLVLIGTLRNYIEKCATYNESDHCNQNMMIYFHIFSWSMFVKLVVGLSRALCSPGPDCQADPTEVWLLSRVVTTRGPNMWLFFLDISAVTPVCVQMTKCGMGFFPRVFCQTITPRQVCLSETCKRDQTCNH